MECKHCRYPDTQIVQTYQDDDLKKTYRRRECVKCGMRFTTQENYRDKFKINSRWQTTPPIKVYPK